MAEQGTVLVQPEPPTVVHLDATMEREEWASYHASIWEARLMAHLHARYFSRMSRWMGWASGFLQLVVIVGSGTAFLSVVSKFGGEGYTAVSTLVVTIAAAILQLSALPGRVQKAAVLEEAWAVRCNFWDDALVMVQGSKYLGPLSALQAPEAALRRVEADLRIPQVAWYIARIQRELMRVDRFARAQVA